MDLYETGDCTRNCQDMSVVFVPELKEFYLFLSLHMYYNSFMFMLNIGWIIHFNQLLIFCIKMFFAQKYYAFEQISECFHLCVPSLLFISCWLS